MNFRPLESNETLRVEETSDTGLEDEKDQDFLALKERIKALERRTTRNLNPIEVKFQYTRVLYYSQSLRYNPRV